MNYILVRSLLARVKTQPDASQSTIEIKIAVRADRASCEYQILGAGVLDAERAVHGYDLFHAIQLLGPRLQQELRAIGLVYDLFFPDTGEVFDPERRPEASSS